MAGPRGNLTRFPILPDHRGTRSNYGDSKKSRLRTCKLSLLRGQSQTGRGCESSFRAYLPRQRLRKLRGDATGLPRWRFTVAATQPELLAQRCHGLAPWRFTVVATQARVAGPKMPRACPVEIHACCYTAQVAGPKMPRACPVEIHGRCYTSPWHLWTQQCVAASVNLHGTSPWHHRVQLW